MILKKTKKRSKTFLSTKNIFDFLELEDEEGERGERGWNSIWDEVHFVTINFPAGQARL